jgi:hypothetical protein
LKIRFHLRIPFQETLDGRMHLKIKPSQNDIFILKKKPTKLKPRILFLYTHLDVYQTYLNENIPGPSKFGYGFFHFSFNGNIGHTDRSAFYSRSVWMNKLRWWDKCAFR